MTDTNSLGRPGTDGWSRNGWRVDAVRAHGGDVRDGWIEVAFNQGTARGFLVEYFPNRPEAKFVGGTGCTIVPDSDEAQEAKKLGAIVARITVNIDERFRDCN